MAVTGRAAEGARVESWKRFHAQSTPKQCKCCCLLFVVGVAINQWVPRVYMRVEEHFILPKHSLNAMERERNGVKMKPRKVKIKISLMGPLFSKQSLEALGKYPLLPPPPSPLGGPVIGRWVGWMDV